uniref:Uncharacterized protein n=1 Tax=Anguilla anguilla TaxID=7936 RepID=A0A0E9SH06_ANGAN
MPILESASLPQKTSCSKNPERSQKRHETTTCKQLLLSHLHLSPSRLFRTQNASVNRVQEKTGEKFRVCSSWV